MQLHAVKKRTPAYFLSVLFHSSLHGVAYVSLMGLPKSLSCGAPRAELRYNAVVLIMRSNSIPDKFAQRDVSRFGLLGRTLLTVKRNQSEISFTG